MVSDCGGVAPPIAPVEPASIFNRTCSPKLGQRYSEMPYRFPVVNRLTKKHKTSHMRCRIIWNVYAATNIHSEPQRDARNICSTVYSTLLFERRQQTWAASRKCSWVKFKLWVTVKLFVSSVSGIANSELRTIRDKVVTKWRGTPCHLAI